MNLQDNKSNKITLEENGRIFPLWVMQNFKKYLLPEIIRKDGEDPCNEKITNELTMYQKFISSYLDYRSPFKDLLVYHGVGSGKTVTVINVYNILYNYTPKWNIFIILPAALRDDPWLRDIKNWLKKENYEDRFTNIVFVHYDSPFADKDFLEKIRKADSSKPFLFIIDEAHRFITNVYNNVSSKHGKRAQVIYDYIQQEKKENDNNRIMLLSATPVINTPFEFALIFNLLRPNSFPTSEALFSQIYISSTNFSSLSLNAKNQFQRRIMGLVSYYLGATPDKYATKIVHYKNVVMGEYQEEVYNYLEEIENQKEKKLRSFSRGKVGEGMSTYSAYTRQSCNFVFPSINNEINGEKRPRPGKFRKKKFEASVIDEGNNLEKKRILLKKNKELELYMKATKYYVNSTINFFKELHRKDKINNHTLQDDVRIFKEENNSSFNLFIKNKENKSNLFNELYNCSPKIINIIFNTLKSKGPVLIYSNYVEMEGLQMLKIYLNFFGFVGINDDPDESDKNTKKKSKIKKNIELNEKKDFFRYVEYHGGIEKEDREKNKLIFNDEENIYGKLAKIIMISQAGAEGINLYNVRQVHILEPYWNEVRIEQVVGRAIRQCHHKALPMEERKVDVFRYKMVRKNGNETADEKMENISRKKNNLLLSFLEAVKEVAVDCELFKAHNMIGTKYNCFQFNQNSLFEDQLGPAYLENFDYDQRINNGSNSLDSMKKKIKVNKIDAVIKFENVYSKSKNYWYNNESYVVYDFELNFPVGKVSVDEYGNPIKLDDNVYIIDKVINIPNFKLFQ